MGSHARLSPSSAHRWTLCPGSVAAEQGRPDTSSDAALLGTHAHSLLEDCLREGHDPMSQIGAWYEDRDVDRDTAIAISTAVDYVKSRTGIVYSEIQVRPESIGRADISGTADVIIWDEELKVLEVIDYKNGRSYVSAENNKQMLIYLIGAINTLNILEWPVRMITTIIQPNAEGEAVRSHEYPAESVSEWIAYFSIAAEKTDLPDAGRFPGEDQCQWCKARGDCPEQADVVLKAARDIFAPVATGEDPLDGYDQQKVPGLSPEQVKLILQSKSFIISLYKDVEAHAYAELEAGRPVPGYKLVEGDKVRAWTLEEEELLRKFKNTSKTDKKKLTQADYLVSKPVSPAQAEKVIKPLVSEKTWGNLEKMVEVTRRKPKMVPESNRKPAINLKPADVFNVVEPTPDFLT